MFADISATYHLSNVKESKSIVFLWFFINF